MKYKGVVTVLITMVMIPLLAWGGSKLFDFESRISKNETLSSRIMSMEVQIKEIHKAVHGY